MKALIIADDANAIERFSAVLKASGYEVIIYRWLVKALDNIEEISPHLILISAKEYPRHWKILSSFVESGIGGIIPQIILYTDKNFPSEEKEKAQKLGIRGFFSSYDVDGLDNLRNILAKTNDIFMGKTEALPGNDFIPTAGKNISLIFINPLTLQFIIGKVISISNEIIDFVPAFSDSSLKENQRITQAMLKVGNSIQKVNAIILKNANSIKLKILAD